MSRRAREWRDARRSKADRELDAALDYLEKAFARHADPEIAAHLAEVLWVQGRKEEARRVWNEARKKHPANESLSDVTQRLGGLAQ